MIERIKAVVNFRRPPIYLESISEVRDFYRLQFFCTQKKFGQRHLLSILCKFMIWRSVASSCEDDDTDQSSLDTDSWVCSFFKLHHSQLWNFLRKKIKDEFPAKNLSFKNCPETGLLLKKIIIIHANSSKYEIYDVSANETIYESFRSL